MKSIVVSLALAVIFGVGMVSGSMAGGNYHGHGMGMSEMSDMDSNEEDGAILSKSSKHPPLRGLEAGLICWTLTTTVKSIRKSGTII